MRKAGLLFFLAVFVPSLLLAWLAVRSARQQELALERQQHLLLQGLASRQVQRLVGVVRQHQREFAQEIESSLVGTDAASLGPAFNERLCQRWPLARVGFAVTLDGKMLSPSLFDNVEARAFRLDNERFLSSRETVEVFWESPKGRINLSRLDGRVRGPPLLDPSGKPASSAEKSVYATKRGKLPEASSEETADPAGPTEFVRLVGDAMEGTLARFLQDKLTVMFWYRSPRAPEIVFGAQVDMATLRTELKELFQPGTDFEVAVALLDDASQPVAVAPADYVGAWRRPFLSEPIGEILPHWEVAVYQLNPARLSQTARTLKLLIGLVVFLLVVAISVGGWLIVRDSTRHMLLARQKTDFVSNVSHELKTPLTSIRMFSELLAEERITDPARRRHYLGIINAEAGRLTRLINNVLDFSRLEQGKQDYHFESCDLKSVVESVLSTFGPHLEESGFKISCQMGEDVPAVRGDCDALAQVVVNLLSNAEKYSGTARQIDVELRCQEAVELWVSDRGPGVPQGSENKIFGQFYRAHDELNSGIQGSGLGLTLARRIARAHGGDLLYRARPGGGSHFILRLPTAGGSGNVLETS